MESEAREFWNDVFFETYTRIAYRFGEEDGADYPFFETRRRLVLDWLAAQTPGTVLDVGCGGGHVLQALLTRGWRGQGVDFSPRMVALARERFDAEGLDAIPFEEGFATRLPMGGEGAFDAVLCLGPLEYLSADEADRALEEARRVLRPGGLFLCAHINQLFDLFTADGFTADFVMQLVARMGSLEEPRLRAVEEQVRSRLTPAHLSAAECGDLSLRRKLDCRADNPLTIAGELEAAGFRMEALAFYRFYCAPPYVYRRLPELQAVTLDWEIERASDWRGHFMASSFLTRSRRL